MKPLLRGKIIALSDYIYNSISEMNGFMIQLMNLQNENLVDGKI